MNARIELVQGDITTLAVDAIVNAANVHLQHGGGVAWAIVKRGGRVIQEESDATIAKLGRALAVGEPAITSAGKLPCRHVIHVAGPVWGEGDEDNKLRLAIRNTIALADEHGLKTVAFPAISTGIYGFPVERAAKLMLAEAAAYRPSHLERVIFCLYDAATHAVFANAGRLAFRE
jgi:O-acetyl-ADP-ribose deacetylase (regulator of RNase III)